MTQNEFNTGQGKYIILNDGKVNDIQAAIELGIETGKIFKKNSKKNWYDRMGSSDSYCSSRQTQ